MDSELGPDPQLRKMLDPDPMDNLAYKYRLGITGTYHGLPVISSGYLEVSTMGESGDLTGPAAASGSLGGRKTLSSPSWGGGSWFRYTSSTAHVFSSSSGTKARPAIRKVRSKQSISKHCCKVAFITCKQCCGLNMQESNTGTF
jgi:hypothetical protein